MLATWHNLLVSFYTYLMSCLYSCSFHLVCCYLCLTELIYNIVWTVIVRKSHLSSTKIRTTKRSNGWHRTTIVGWFLAFYRKLFAPSLQGIYELNIQIHNFNLLLRFLIFRNLGFSFLENRLILTSAWYINHTILYHTLFLKIGSSVLVFVNRLVL